MIKPQSLIVFPLIGFLALIPIFKSRNKLTLRSLLPPFELVLTIAVTAAIVTLPFIWSSVYSVSDLITGPVDLIIERFNASYGQYTASSLNAFNFWGAVAMWQDDGTKFLGISFRNIGTLIFVAVYAVIIGLLLRYTAYVKEIDKRDFGYYVFQAIMLVLFTLFLFVTRAHERHLLPMIVFFTLITFRTWIFWYLYAIVSVIYVLNMVYSYFQLTTLYQAVPLEYSIYFIPGIFSVYLAAYIIVLAKYVVDNLNYRNKFDKLSPRTR